MSPRSPAGNMPDLGTVVPAGKKMSLRGQCPLDAAARECISSPGKPSCRTRTAGSSADVAVFGDNSGRANVAPPSPNRKHARGFGSRVASFAIGNRGRSRRADQRDPAPRPERDGGTERDGADLPSERQHISRVSIFGSLFFVAGVLYLCYVLVRSPYQTQVAHRPRAAGAVQPRAPRHGSWGSTAATATRRSRPPSIRACPPTETCMTATRRSGPTARMLAAGPGELARQDADPVEPGPRPAGLRLLPPRRSTSRRGSAARPATAASTRCP